MWKRNENVLKSCRGCPLRIQNWCKAVGPTSRLHNSYHHNDKAWLKDVGKFVSMMEKMILKRKGAKGK